MDRRIIMGKVVEEWKEMEGKRRGGRKTGEGRRRSRRMWKEGESNTGMFEGEERRNIGKE